MVSVPGARELGRRGKRGGGRQGGSNNGREKPFSCKECVLGTVSDRLLSSNAVFEKRGSLVG
jgi:hypothetical protein